MWTPSGAQLGFSFLPSPCVNCTYSLVATFGSAREFVKRPIWRGLERLCPTEGRRLARQSLLSEPQIRRWRPVLWGRTFHASSRSRKEPSHPIDSSWVGTPARLICWTLEGIGIPHRAPWLGRRVPTKAAGIPWSPNGENRSIPRRLKNLECCPQTRPLSPETLRPGRPSLASQSSRIKPFRPEPNERIRLYSFLLRALLISSPEIITPVKPSASSGLSFA